MESQKRIDLKGRCFTAKKEAVSRTITFLTDGVCGSRRDSMLEGGADNVGKEL